MWTGFYLKMSNGMTHQISTWGLDLSELNVFTMSCISWNSWISLIFLDNIPKDELSKWKILCKAFFYVCFLVLPLVKGSQWKKNEPFGCRRESNEVHTILMKQRLEVGVNSHKVIVSLHLRVQNAVPAQPCVGKLGISLVLLNFLHCNFRLWFKTP